MAVEKGGLVLTRRPGESIVIGDNAEIVITLGGINGNQARIVVKAPKDVPVHREEVYERNQVGKD